MVTGIMFLISAALLLLTVPARDSSLVPVRWVLVIVIVTIAPAVRTRFVVSRVDIAFSAERLDRALTAHLRVRSRAGGGVTVGEYQYTYRGLPSAVVLNPFIFTVGYLDVEKHRL